MTELHFKLTQLGVGWAALAILHILLALFLARTPLTFPLFGVQNGGSEGGKLFISTLVITGYGLAALAVLPSLALFDGNALVYPLGNFIALSAWGASFAYHRRPGFYAAPPAVGATPAGSGDKRAPVFYRLLKSGAIYHWFAALPLPCWLWTLFTANNRPADFSLVLALAALAWGMVIISHWLAFAGRQCRRPWRLVGLLVSVAAPIAAFLIVPDGYTPAITLLAAGLLYFADALASRQSDELYPAGLVTAWGLALLLDHAQADGNVIILALCALIGVYFLSGLFAERRKVVFAASSAGHFLAPLYRTGHILSFIVLLYIYSQWLSSLSQGSAWTTDQVLLWGSIDQLLLAAFYALYAWGRYQKSWAYIAVWLAAAGGGFLALIYSTGQGSLAAKAALIVAALILAERLMCAFRRFHRISSRVRAYIRLAWGLYSQPLLFTGWTASAGVIGLALIRNFLILGGGRTQQTWAAIALLIITALYALAARLFKQARFVSLATCLIAVPWTICANLGWFLFPSPALTELAVSWMALAWFYFLVSLPLRRYAPAVYSRPPAQATQVFIPFSLLWAVADVSVSRYTFGLAIALYAVLAWLDYRRARGSDAVTSISATKYLYPALALIPLWSVYWLKYWQPAARHEHFGLLLLSFGALGLLAGQALERLAPRPPLARAYGLPAYLTGYVTLIVGLLLTAHIPGLLVFALLYAALLMVVSAWIFKSPLWVYPAAGLLAFSLMIALGEAAVPLTRRGWWLMGLAAVYLGAGWLLRRFKLNAYASAAIGVAFVLIALGLPPSSQDRVSAFWGYGSAALLYVLSAFWLGQPLLLAAACALIVVPYASVLQQSPLLPQYYGLALLPGAVLALGIGQVLDARLGAWRDFPWPQPFEWFPAFAQRLLGWWAFAFYLLGFGLASAAPFFTAFQTGLVSLNFFLLAVFYAWAVYRFRARFWLWAGALALHLAAVFFLRYLGLRSFDAEFWLRFLPLTALMMALALWLEKRLNEGSPLDTRRIVKGWSRPLYFFVLADLFLAQLGSLRSGGLAGMWLSLANLLLIGVLASVWDAPVFTYLSTLLGLVALTQWRAAGHLSADSLSVHLAWLALGYGLLGFGYRLFLRWQAQGAEKETLGPHWLSVWELPLQRSAMLLSILALVITPRLGMDLAGWAVRALFGVSLRRVVNFETVRMVVWVLSLVGLLYTAAAAVYRRLRLGYLALAMLLGAWFVYALYINLWDNLKDAQWYALPAGLYLLLIGYLEWTRGNKRLARWLDYAALVLLLGSLFWQTLSFGLAFSLTLIVEGLLLFGWGIARRLRRFFYVGLAGVMLAVLGQLVNGLQAANLWLIWGTIGLLTVVTALVVELNMEKIKALQAVLETWE